MTRWILEVRAARLGRKSCIARRREMTVGGIFYMCYVKSVQIRPVWDLCNAPPTSSGAPGPPCEQLSGLMRCVCAGEAAELYTASSTDAAASIPPLFTVKYFHVSASVVFTALILFILFIPRNHSPSIRSKGEKWMWLHCLQVTGMHLLILIQSTFNFCFVFHLSLFKPGKFQNKNKNESKLNKKFWELLDSLSLLSFWNLPVNKSKTFPQRNNYCPV